MYTTTSQKTKEQEVKCGNNNRDSEMYIQFQRKEKARSKYTLLQSKVVLVHTQEEDQLSIWEEIGTKQSRVYIYNGHAH